MLQQVIIFRINMHIHIHFLLSLHPYSPAPIKSALFLANSSSNFTLVSGHGAKETPPPFFFFFYKTLNVHWEVISMCLNARQAGLGAARLHAGFLS